MDYPKSVPNVGLVNGKFIDENTVTGAVGSLIPAAWGSAVTDELLAVITASGLEPDERDLKQLSSAISRIIDRAQHGVLTDIGAAGAYAAVNPIPLTALPSTGHVQRVRIANANPGASTYEPDGLAAKPIYGLGLQPLQGGELLPGVATFVYLVQAGVNAGNGAWILVESLGGAFPVAPATQSRHALSLGQASALFAAQPGEVEWFATMTPPPTHLAANGSAVSRTTYANLFNALTAQPTGSVTSGSKSITGVVNPSAMWVGMPISGPGIPAGTTVAAVAAGTITLSVNATATTASATLVICPYGIGDGTTTFNVPDMRGKVARGWDNGAGIDTGRVFGSYQADAYATHSHGINDPGHSHYVNDPGHFHSVQSGSALVSLSGGGLQYGVTSGAQNTQSAGTGIWLNSAATGISTQAAGGGAETRVKNVALLACIKF